MGWAALRATRSIRWRGGVPRDWLRMLACDNGLSLATVRRSADRFGEREDFGRLIDFCEDVGSERVGKSAHRGTVMELASMIMPARLGPAGTSV